MHVTFYPSGSEALASSRLRVYTLAAVLRMREGVRVSIAEADAADVVVIQKRLPLELLKKLPALKAAGKRLVYDTDDVGEIQSPQIDVIVSACRLMDVVTTDTAGHAKQLMRDFKCRHVEVIPDPIDYFPTGPQRSSATPTDHLRVLWFGCRGAFEYLVPWLEALLAIPALQLVAVTDEEALPSLRKEHPRIEFHGWKLGEFVARLQTCHLSCLVHARSDVARFKSNNKMIASINWGVPALVSNSVEYARTARECGAEEAVFEDLDGLRRAIETFRSPAARLRYLEKAQPVVWRNYSPAAVADRYLALLGRILRRSPGGSPASFQS